MGRGEPGDSHPIITEWEGQRCFPARCEWSLSHSRADLRCNIYTFFYESRTFPNFHLPQDRTVKSLLNVEQADEANALTSLCLETVVTVPPRFRINICLKERVVASDYRFLL
jgi:hypothetical protein